MKRKIFGFSLMASIGLFAFGVVGLSACNQTSQVAKFATVRMSEEKLDMQVGESKTLKAFVSPKSYASAEQYWVSTNTNVVRVIKNSGNIVAVGEGNAQVHVYIGGGRAICDINVSGQAAGDNTPGVYVQSSVSVQLGKSTSFSYTVIPAGTGVSFVSADESIATLSTSGNTVTVNGLKVGTTTITATSSHETPIVKAIAVSVTESGGGQPGEEEDIAVDPNLGATGSFIIGSPKAHISFINERMKDFNTLTKSSITWTMKEFEENEGTGSLASAAAAPDVFAYASDQTLVYYQFEVLDNLSSENANWVKNNMPSDAYSSSRLNARTVGYPFAADNGVVMFYDNTITTAEEIDTLPKLFDKAKSLSYEVDYNIADGFYGAGALMSYTGGESLYTLTPDGKEYTSTSSFNTAAGIQGAKLITSLYNENQGRLRSTIKVPGSTTKCLATIVSTSRASEFKEKMGDKYAVAPLPFIDDTRTTRLGSYLGYKFYAVNKTLAGSDKGTTAHNIAKFLSSEYVQKLRFEQLNVQPTMNSLQSACAAEPHVAALNAQKEAKSTILMTALNPEYWSQVGSAIEKIKDEGATVADDKYVSILQALDKVLTKTE